MSIALAAHAAWMPAKAALAQHLLATSWSAARADGQPHRPWPWADTHPVARLHMPRLGVSQVVLAGDAGRMLAFGPGWAEASAAPGSDRGTTIISGHRDSHFGWLSDLRAGDTVELESAHGPRRYTVASTRVVDSRTHGLGTDADGLVLVTCYPFDALAPGGPLRYVVSLDPTEKGNATYAEPGRLVADAR
jgi:sortase A